MSVKIIVLSDGETWETFNDSIEIVEITDEGYNQLCDGLEPNDLEKTDIIRRKFVSQKEE